MTKSKRPIGAWEPLIIYGGRELSVDRPRTVCDALSYAGCYRTFPGALVGMKPPRFAVWMFHQLGARAGDQLVDLYPGSGAITEAWRRYTGAPRAVGEVGVVDARHAAASEGAPGPRAYDLPVVGREQAHVSGQRHSVRVGRVPRGRLHRRGGQRRRGAGGVSSTLACGRATRSS